MRILPFLILACLVAACATFPDVDSVASKSAEGATYPELVPLEDIADPGDGHLTEDSASALEGRFGGLKRRADELRRRPIE